MAAPKKQQQFKPEELLPLAALLIKDNYFDRALKTLHEIDLEEAEADENFDWARFYTLLGMAEMGLNHYAPAKDDFYKAIEKGQKEPLLYVYLAQCHFGLQEYEQTLTSIGKLGDLQKGYPSLYEMAAQSHWQLKNHDRAWAALNAGEALFPERYSFLERKTFYALELGLYQEAAAIGTRYLELSKAKPKAYVAIGNALRLSKQYTEAARIMEVASLRFPSDVKIAKVLAHTYLDQGKTHAAAGVLERISRYDPEFFSEAAELYKRAGRYYRALELNARVSDQKVKLKQRMAILIALKHYEKVTNMEQALYRAQLLSDEPIRYALGFAAFSTGQFADAKRHLAFVKESQLFRQAVELQKLMKECEEASWKCA
ncbi:MAG: CDC27 family protein [Methylococcales bacterium]|nr:CDC27 family protein [Methylococcales bacterium]